MFFEVGREFPVATKDFDGVLADIADMKTESGCTNIGSYCANDNIVSAHGVYFNNSHQGRHIQLQSDGTFRVRAVETYHSMFNYITSYYGSWETFNIPDNGIIFVEDNVWIDGQINNEKVTM